MEPRAMCMASNVKESTPGPPLKYSGGQSVGSHKWTKYMGNTGAGTYAVEVQSRDRNLNKKEVLLGSKMTK